MKDQHDDRDHQQEHMLRAEFTQPATNAALGTQHSALFRMGKQETRIVQIPKWITVLLLLLVSALMVLSIDLLSGHAYRRKTTLADIASGFGSSSAVLAMMAPAIADALFFLPWGALTFLALDRPERSRKAVYGVTLALGVAFALGLIGWQAVLPTRVTGGLDPLWNMVGCTAGAALGHARKRFRVRFE